MENFWLLLIALISYLLGSIPFAYIVAKKMTGKNLCYVGTRNVGAMNAYRTTGSTKALIMVLSGDTIKAIISILSVSWLGFLGYNLKAGLVIAAFFVILGHNYSCFLKFKGGKGLASLLGILLALDWRFFLISIVIALFVAFIVKVFYDLLTYNLASWKSLSKIKEIVDYRIGVLETLLNLILICFYQSKLILPILAAAGLIIAKTAKEEIQKIQKKRLIS